MIKQSNGALKAVLVNYSILEPIGDLNLLTAGRTAAWNAAGKAAKPALDGGCFQRLIEHG